MGDITVIILSYKRPFNAEKYIEGIRKQTVPSEIWVWDNGLDFPAERIKDCDLYIT